HYVTQYGHQKEFMAIKIHNKIDNNGHLMNLYYKYEFGGMYKLKKTNHLQNQHNKDSKKLNCDWKINLLSATGLVRITSFNNHYTEHQLSPDTNIFALINHQFSDDYHDKICHLVINSRCDLSTIRSFITAKYPNQLFLIRDLANIVAQLWREHSVKRNDTSRLLMQLYEYKEIDSNWYIKPLIDPVSNRLHEVFWIDPSQRE
ncbi:19439_t:CDS:1, partial [Racocetra persica]